MVASAILTGHFAVEYIVWVLQQLPFIVPPALAFVALGVYPDLGHFLVDHTPPATWLIAFLLNLGVWFFGYGAAWLATYTTNLCRSVKFNPTYPSNSKMFEEMLRCVPGVAVATLWELALLKLGVFTTDDITMDRSIYNFFAVFVVKWQFLLGLWGDAHFYVIHRLLHEVSFLYKYFHKVHHKSNNPDPWSGLSMHPVEHLIFFSALAICLVVPMPYWIFRIFKYGYILGPISAHCGMLVDEHHYLHHAWFSFNYGSSPLFDHICGTSFSDLDVRRKTGILEAAKRQAELAGAKLQKTVD